MYSEDNAYIRNNFKNYIHLPLTSVCYVHSNVYGLGDIHCITYFTTVDSIHSMPPAMQIHYHPTSCSVKVPLGTAARNPSSIWEVPVFNSRPSYINGISIRSSATTRLVSQAEQGIITFTNLLQGHETVVLVCCTSEWEPDTTCTREENITVGMLSKLVLEFVCKTM